MVVTGRWMRSMFCAAAVAWLPASGWALEAPELGWHASPDRAIESAAEGLLVGTTVEWGAIERGDGTRDWSSIDRLVDVWRASGARIGLTLSSRHPARLPGGGYPAPADPDAFEAWIAFVGDAAARYAGRVETLQIGDRLPPSSDPEELRVYGFLLKRSALAVRSAIEGRAAMPDVAQATVSQTDLDAQRALWDADAAAYVDRLTYRLDDAQADPVEAYRAFYGELILHPPAARLEVRLPSGLPDPERAAVAVRLLAAGAGSVRLDRSPAAHPAFDAWCAGMVNVLGDGYAPAPLGSLSLRSESGAPLEVGRVLGRFTRDEDFRSLIAYLVEAAPDGSEAVRLRVDSRRVREAYAVDPIENRSLRTGSREAGGGFRELRAPVGAWPRLLTFSRAVATPGFELPPEDLEVEQTRGLTAEEIIARNQAVSQAQADRLERWIAEGQARINFSFSQGAASIDWSIEGRYFWDPENGLEWEQREHYINGNRLPWKKIPEIPQIQPEKVVTLPLDLSFDKTYTYRLVGEDRVRGAEAYVLEFQPAGTESDASLYRGRVWIDRTTFRTLRTSLIQSGLEAPVRSNEERDGFSPFAGEDGEYWLLAEISGQQIWSIGGRNVNVQREIVFERYEINPPLESYEAAKAEAYASSHLMLRDTDDGLKYLTAEKDGTRVLQETTDRSRWFAAAGVLKDTSTDGVTPLAGVNYFNFDAGGRGWQTDVLFGGVVALANASKPDLFGGRADFTAEGALFAIRFEDTFYVGDVESAFESIRERPQSVRARLGFPLGQFVKATASAAATWVDYAGEEDAEAALAAFNAAQGTSYVYRPPEDHLRTEAGFSVEFIRRGYKLSASGEWNRRSDWQPFGLFDPVGGTFLAFDGTDANDPAAYAPVPDPVLYDSFSTWRAVAAKEWFLPHFQKIRTELNYLDGTDLDRFSRYEFSFFGSDRLNGFAGSGVRFDQGTLARAGYAFNLFEAIRFELGLEGARVESGGGPAQQFEGVGLLANFVGPWKTVISLNVGYALGSDIPGLEGETEVFLLVLKLF